MRFIVQILTNALAIYLAVKLLPQGIEFTGDWTTLVLAGFVMGLANFFLKPILKLISLPFIILTFGLFTIAINMIILGVVAALIPELTIKSLGAAFWAVIIISLVNIFIGIIIKK